MRQLRAAIAEQVRLSNELEEIHADGKAEAAATHAKELGLAGRKFTNRVEGLEGELDVARADADRQPAAGHGDERPAPAQVARFY